MLLDETQLGLQATSPTNTMTMSSFTSTSTRTNGTWAVRPASHTILQHVQTSFPHHRGTSDSPDTKLHSPNVSLSISFRENQARGPRTLRPTRADSLHTSSPIAPSQVTFQWVKGELLGKGSYGHVYLALNATNGEILAVKQVELLRNPSGQSTSRQLEVIEALKFESDTLQELDHPHIVQYLGFEESLDHLSFFMEYVSGGSIGSCLKAHGRFDEEVTKSFTRQILNGLEYLHSKGIIHRDLKADNILVEVSGICKISDFGISKQAGEIDGRAFTEMKGTSFWMAPEAFNPKETHGYDAKVDIWSIGCVILEMWTAKRPWYGYELWPVMMKVCTERLAPPLPDNLHLSKAALDIRDKCFKKDPRDRPSAAELQYHPYLVMRPGWCFDQSDIEGPQSSEALNEMLTIRRVKSSTSLSRRSHYNEKNLPPVPLLPPLFFGYHPRASVGSQVPPAPVNAPPPLPPPIIHITPPGSPSRSSPYAQPEENSPSPSTSNSSSKWSTPRKKSFYVANPDPEEYLEPRSAFVYHPPPLPNTNSRTLHPSPRRTPSTPALRRSAVPTRSSSTNCSDSDSETYTGSSMWQKPPPDMRLRSRPKSKGAGRLSLCNKRDSAWERPFLEDIYQDLQAFFPDHDIDEPIIKESEDANTPTSVSASREIPSGLKRGKKSIRMVAQEQVKRSQSISSQRRRRTTKLWGGRLQEVPSS